MEFDHEEITLNPDNPEIKHFIEKSVERHIDTPVQYAFEDGWPVELSMLETEEVVDAVDREPQLIRGTRVTSSKEKTLMYLENKMVDT